MIVFFLFGVWQLYCSITDKAALANDLVRTQLDILPATGKSRTYSVPNSGLTLIVVDSAWNSGLSSRFIFILFVGN